MGKYATFIQSWIPIFNITFFRIHIDIHPKRQKGQQTDIFFSQPYHRVVCIVLLQFLIVPWIGIKNVYVKWIGYRFTSFFLWLNIFVMQMWVRNMIIMNIVILYAIFSTEFVELCVYYNASNGGFCLRMYLIFSKEFKYGPFLKLTFINEWDFKTPYSHLSKFSFSNLFQLRNLSLIDMKIQTL